MARNRYSSQPPPRTQSDVPGSSGGLVYWHPGQMSNRIRLCARQRPTIAQAEGVGFEPTEHFCSRVFETRAFDRTMLPLQAKKHYSTAARHRQTIWHLWHQARSEIMGRTDPDTGRSREGYAGGFVQSRWPHGLSREGRSEPDLSARSGPQASTPGSARQADVRRHYVTSKRATGAVQSHAMTALQHSPPVARTLLTGSSEPGIITARARHC